MELIPYEEDKKDTPEPVRKARSKLARLLGICDDCGEKSFNCKCKK